MARNRIRLSGKSGILIFSRGQEGQSTAGKIQNNNNILIKQSHPNRAANNKRPFILAAHSTADPAITLLYDTNAAQ